MQTTGQSSDASKNVKLLRKDIVMRERKPKKGIGANKKKLRRDASAGWSDSSKVSPT
jgi:hypothetical protein